MGVAACGSCSWAARHPRSWSTAACRCWSYRSRHKGSAYPALSGYSPEHPYKTAVSRQENFMVSEKGPNIKKKQKCKNCEGKGLLKKGDKVVKCQRCKGTGVR